MYRSTKKIGPISTGHRQWRDDGHCSYVNGYGRYVQFTFASDALDHRGWVMDFGGLKGVKKWLEEQWDHRLLLSSDDPLLDEFRKIDELGGCNINVMDVAKGYGPGIEQSCKFVYDHVNPMIIEATDGKAWLEKVEVWEHELNSAYYTP